MSTIFTGTGSLKREWLIKKQLIVFGRPNRISLLKPTIKADMKSLMSTNGESKTITELLILEIWEKSKTQVFPQKN